jgi:hypothetical protein
VARRFALVYRYVFFGSPSRKFIAVFSARQFDSETDVHYENGKVGNLHMMGQDN